MFEPLGFESVELHFHCCGGLACLVLIHDDTLFLVSFDAVYLFGRMCYDVYVVKSIRFGCVILIHLLLCLHGWTLSNVMFFE